MIHLLVPSAPSGRNPSLVNIECVPPHKNELEYGFPRVSIGHASTVPPPFAGDDAQCALQRGFRNSLLPMIAVDEEARNSPVGRRNVQLAVSAHPAWQLEGRSELAPANDIRAIIDERRVGPIFSNELLLSVLCFPVHSFSSLRLRWNAVHQQPPHTPLCFSTTRAKSGNVSPPSSLIRNRFLSCLTCFVREDKSPFGSTYRLVNFFMSRISRPLAI